MERERERGREGGREKEREKYREREMCERKLAEKALLVSSQRVSL